MNTRKKCKNNVFRTWIVSFLLIFIFGMIRSESVFAAPNASSAPSSSKEETTEYLPLYNNGSGNTTVGRYQFNYTGNWNYFSNINAVYCYEDEVRRNTYLAGWQNSSGATLTNSSGATGIVKAYLIWETRAPYEQWNESANHVVFHPNSGSYYNIYPDYVYNDNRKFSGWGNTDHRRCYVMVSDVTSIVQAYGYGDYYVANIPEHHITHDAGGDNVCSWQLVVVEEGNDFPVRALTLKVGAKWRFGDAAYGDSSYLDTNVTFSNGIKSKSSGSVSGQLLFGCANDHDSMYTNLSTTLYTADGSGNRTRAAGSTLYGGGLYKNGGKQITEYGIIADLRNMSSGLGNNATVVGAEVNNIYWNTMLYVGTAIDIAFPDFTASQKTTVNSSDSVTVTGSIKNVSQSANTGIYNGNLVVTLDSALKATSAVALVDGNKTISGSISGNTVTFSGEAIRNIMKGNTITYTIECSTDNSGKTKFENSDSFSGYLTADGINTGYPIRNVCASTSSAVPMYKITLESGTGIKSVIGAGDYTYGKNVTIDAELLPGYHWLQWTGSINTDVQEYSFPMPAKNLSITAQGEANRYTIVFHPNDGTEVIPIETMVVTYDQEVTLPDVLLPDGSESYVKYTLDGVNVTEQILSGAIVIDETGRVLRQGTEGYPEGSVISPDGTVTTPEGTVIMPDGTVIMPDGTVTAPDGTVTAPDGTVVMPDGTITSLNGGGECQASEFGNVTTEQVDESIVESEMGTTIEQMDESTTEQESESTTEASVERKEVRLVGEPEAEEVTVETEPQPDKRAYASVFMGWSLEDGKDSFIPQWKASEPIEVKTLVEAAGVTEQDGAEIVLYAVWDDCPWIQATNLYYTLGQAQSGYITEAEILSHATALDREDGSPIAAGVHENGTSFTIPDYAATDFTQFQHEGSCTENLTVVDSAGNTYSKQITVYIVDTTPVAVNPEGTTRFINEYYYNQSYEYGGLEDNSIWKTDPEYAAELIAAFENSKNNTPIQTFSFTHEEILQMQEFVRANGVGNTQRDDALTIFYNQFLAPNLQ